MRKFLMSLTVLAGATAFGAAAQAAPYASPLSVPVFGQATVQTVQYHEDWRRREWRRREAYEQHRRQEERRHHGHGHGHW